MVGYEPFLFSIQVLEALELIPKRKFNFESLESFRKFVEGNLVLEVYVKKPKRFTKSMKPLVKPDSYHFELSLY